MRWLDRVALLAALSAFACGKTSPTAPSPTSTSTSASAATRVVSLSGSLAFGAVEIGKTSDMVLAIGNSGTDTLSVIGITAPAGYTVNWTSGTIAPGASRQVTVRFAPTAAQSYDGILVVNGDHTGGSNTAPLSGTGAPTPAPTPPPPTPPPAPPSPTPTPPTPPPPTPPPSATAYDDEILALVNNHRKSIGKTALAQNQTIWAQANSHSQNMASKKVAFGHDGFDARIAAIRAALGSGGSAAENVAMGYSSAAAVVNGWLSSPGHRANIEGSSTRTGVSAVKSSDGVWYYTQIFY